MKLWIIRWYRDTRDAVRMRRDLTPSWRFSLIRVYRDCVYDTTRVDTFESFTPGPVKARICGIRVPVFFALRLIVGCKQPPYGYWCSRVHGHDGPCAARLRWWLRVWLWLCQRQKDMQ